MYLVIFNTSSRSIMLCFAYFKFMKIHNLLKYEMYDNKKKYAEIH